MGNRSKLSDHDIIQLKEQCKEQLEIIDNYHKQDIEILNILGETDAKIKPKDELPILRKIRKLVIKNNYMNKVLLDKGICIEFCDNPDCNAGFKQNKGFRISKGNKVSYYCSMGCLKIGIGG